MALMLIMINCANLCLCILWIHECILWIHECILGSWNSVLLELPWENGDSLGGTGWSMSEFSWDVKYAGVQTLVVKVIIHELKYVTCQYGLHYMTICQSNTSTMEQVHYHMNRLWLVWLLLPSLIRVYFYTMMICSIS